MKIHAIIEKDEHGYYAFVPELQGCVSQGDTWAEARKNIKEAIELFLDTFKIHGKPQIFFKKRKVYRGKNNF